MHQSVSISPLDALLAINLARVGIGGSGYGIADASCGLGAGGLGLGLGVGNYRRSLGQTSIQSTDGHLRTGDVISGLALGRGFPLGTGFPLGATRDTTSLRSSVASSVHYHPNTVLAAIALQNTGAVDFGPCGALNLANINAASTTSQSQSRGFSLGQRDALLGLVLGF